MLGDTARGNDCPAGQAHRLPAAEGGGGRGAEGQKPGRQALRQSPSSGQQGKPSRQPPRGGVRRGAAAAARGTRPQPEAAGPAEPRAGGSGGVAHRKRRRGRGVDDDAAAQCSQSDRGEDDDIVP